MAVASCIAHGAGATARPESPITHDAESTEKMAYIYPWGLAENMAYTYTRGPAYKTQNTSRWEGVPMQAKHKNTGRWEGVN